MKNPNILEGLLLITAILPFNNLVFGTQTLTCTCTEYVNKAGFGNCTGYSQFSPHGSLVACFVRLPSSCNDLVDSFANPGKKMSVQACKFREGKLIIFISRKFYSLWAKSASVR